MRTYIVGAVALALFIFALGLWRGWFSLNSYRARAYDVWGLDVSHHQGPIAWSQVVRDPRIRFVFIKATEGDDWRDLTFADNWRDARRVGLATGAYHFFSFCSEPAAQVAHFLAVAPLERESLPPMVDVELGGNCRIVGSDAEVRARLRRFLMLLEQRSGRRPVVYATNEAFDRFVKDAGFANPLWLRDVVGEPVGWQFWQFANRGHVAGIHGYVDINAFAGSEEALRRL